MIISQRSVSNVRIITTQLCNFSIVLLEKFLSFNLLYVYIHDISSNLFFVAYMLNFYFPVFLLIHFSDTPNRLGGGFHSTMFMWNQGIWLPMVLSSYIRCFNNCHKHFLMKTLYISALSNFMEFLF